MKEQSLQEFVSQLASPTPVPGGGGVSALAGALGSALGAMAANLTVDKKKFADVKPLMESSIQSLTQLSQDMLRYIEDDAQAFEPLSKAYGLPRDTPEQLAERERILQAALVEAAQPPLRIMRACKQALDTMDKLSGTVSRLVVSDVGCGAALCRACMESASLNVYINARMLTNASIAQPMFDEAHSLVAQGRQTADEIFSSVEDALCQPKS